jgi:uncharacterized protein YxjI
MDELQTIANKRDQCHLNKGPHGNVLAQNYKYYEDPHHVEKLKKTVQEYSLDESYLTIKKTKKKETNC